MGRLMNRILRGIILAFALLCGGTAFAQGTIPIALVQQMNINGTPLAGCLVYFYQAGTVSTPQNSFQDFGLSIVNLNPLICDQFGRVPMFWLANGLIHVRLTDPSGVVQLDTTMQVLGPSTGSGGGGSTVDPTTIAATGDIKFRMTAETVTGWVKLNSQTIGSASSGATGRANADTQNLFVYLWTNCPNAHCPVIGGRGSTALADYSANKQLTLPDWRDRAPVGRDCMEATCAAGLLSSNITSGGGDGVDTPGASGGAANPLIAQTNLPNVNFAVTIPSGQGSHTHTISGASGQTGSNNALGNNGNAFTENGTLTTNAATLPAMTGTAASGGSATPFGTIGPLVLGSWYVKL